MKWTKAKRLLAGLALGGIALVTTASCDPQRGTFDLYRNDDDHGFFDIFIEDDCYFWEDCHYDDYWYDEIVIWG